MLRLNTSFKLILGLIALVLLLKLSVMFFIEPLALKKIQSVLNEKSKDYAIKIDAVRISLLQRSLELKTISISTKKENKGDGDIQAAIGFVKLKGISLLKVVFKKDIDISEVFINNSSIIGEKPFLKEKVPAILSPLNIRIGKIIFNNVDLSIRNTLNPQAIVIKKAFLKVYEFQVNKLDTISTGLLNQFDFTTEELVSVSSNGMYTFKVNGAKYSTTSNALTINVIIVQPNFTNYDFTSRYKYQKDRFEVELKNISARDFSFPNYFKSASLISSYIEIGQMDMVVFRDKRKEFQHVDKPIFQEIIYNYKGAINIDSLFVKGGNVTYSEHADKANEPGSISLNQINCKVFKISNDSIYKTTNDFLILKAEALLMGKGKFTFQLKSKLFEKQNTFSFSGTLSDLETKELNPILEKTAFVYASSGKIDEMDFNFIANNDKSTGKLILRYQGLSLAFKNKQTDDTTAVKEWFISILANKKILDSNPLPGEELRVGIIDFKRDTERSVINYCLKSLFSGIKSTLVKSPKKKG